MQNANFVGPNSIIGGRLGSVEYQATCGCSYQKNYPFALGPHLGVAYQITSKTVFRAEQGNLPRGDLREIGSRD